MSFCSLLLVAAAVLSQPTTPAPEPLTVMSYNLRFGSADDGPDRWELRRDSLVGLIKRHDPMVLGTQECLDFQAQYIADQLPEYTWFGLGREADGTGEMTAILFKKSRLLPLESGHLWLSETPDVPGSISWDSSLTRIASWVKFYDRVNQRSFYFYNTHFDHRGAVARLESARRLEERIRTQHDGEPVVLTGDFNAAGGTSEPWKALTAGPLKDTWDTAEETRGVAMTWNGFRPPVAGEERRIDWILATPEVRILSCEIDAYSENGRFPSDHMPVIAQISLAARDQ